ncbi:methyltransferase domain-containing protein [Nonomuraea sp. NEAU-A123]|uniref:methyltransferase domain-containing protein n=1 Tax=Nonomuraea sp. NEAU-A123 TaxID=2839649 RepID=UPI001BE49FE9|nr:methyltransferase domain-containing protein [Nonomuraea sp. NEAU-A123]MBT2230538.1 methyltransferase domain-containing protein [Nonomuraea sp. NEAU-A123]
MNNPGRIERMIDEIRAVSARSEWVLGALRAVPRHLFIPSIAQAFVGLGERESIIDRDADPDTWWEVVYSDSTLVTQLDDGATEIRLGATGATSAGSAPSTVADLLQWLDPEPGHRVLEVGTGTGWTAALLSHVVGETNVTSIEIDTATAEQAVKNLTAAGAQPYLVVGDGADGLTERAPFDRVHVTCGIHTVPYAWIEQSRPGAVIVAPYCPGFGLNHALRLVVRPDGTAIGRFPGFASYMMMRSQRPVEVGDTDPDQARPFTTRIDPRTLAYAPAGADLAISALTGLHSHTYREDDFHRMWVMGGSDQWAAATWEPKREQYEAFQIGDRAVWQEAVDAYFQWVSWGEPGRDRFGMTVTAEGQRIWLDTPERVVG